eukprot:TRINITY_DN6304_c0_g3_i1.p1 TRINITY_DN6304_c0_g3~~TRINITY_DN6304_c0_g3_i1.p1  ORF type:complete len:249 (-),score=62.33 TRINITY_DN6304_c0_g3_i1:26-772(-)
MLKSGGMFDWEARMAGQEAFNAAVSEMLTKQYQERNGLNQQVAEQRETVYIGKSGAERDREQEAKNEDHDENNEDDEDEDEDDEILAEIQAKRRAELRREFDKLQELKSRGHGAYQEITQDEFLPTVTGSQYVIAHFFLNTFERCKIMDKHLNLLAVKHMDTKFFKIDVEKAPFFVQKLAVRVLPCVICFIDGVAVDRVVGFDEIGGQDEFQTTLLERRIWQSGVIEDGSGRRAKPRVAPVRTLIDSE